MIISVAIELVAMAEAQPKVWNFTSSMTSSSVIFRYMRMISPHLALPTSPTPLASSRTPTFCEEGCCGHDHGHAHDHEEE